MTEPIVDTDIYYLYEMETNVAVQLSNIRYIMQTRLQHL